MTAPTLSSSERPSARRGNLYPRRRSTGDPVFSGANALRIVRAGGSVRNLCRAREFAKRNPRNIAAAVALPLILPEPALLGIGRVALLEHGREPALGEF